MINVKDQIYSALCEAFDNVTDIYPMELIKQGSFPAVQYTEEANNVVTKTDKEEQLAYLRYRIDIWEKGSTSLSAIEVDKAIAPLGLTRIECSDTPDPSGLRHKQMRYEGTIDVENEVVYWEGGR